MKSRMFILMARRNVRALIPVLFYLMFMLPPMVIAESNDLKEADTCRIKLLKAKKGEKTRGRWKRCINLYKETSSFKERQGRAAYEVARLYHTRFLSSDQTSTEDLVEAEKYYKNAIRQNRMEDSLIAHAKQLLRAVKSELNVRSQGTAEKTPKATAKAVPRTNGETIPIDTDAAPPLNFVVSPRFSYGVKIGFEVRKRENRDFRDAKDDNDLRFESQLSLAALYRIGTGMKLFGELKIEDEENFEPERKGGHSRSLKGRFKKGYLSVNRFIIPSVRLQLGRQRLKDSREWVIDEQLDAARIFFQFKAFESELSISTNLFDPQNTKDETVNYFTYHTFRFGKRSKAAFYIMIRRNPDIDLRLTFSGISVKARAGRHQKYWLQLGRVSGTDGPSDVSGYGLDIGWSRRFKVRYRPYIILGYAFGSGDNAPDDARDKNFRQTGLQDNAAKTWGVTRSKYYGELFEPELSNLMIGTLGFGISLNKESSVEIIFHKYSQVWAYPKRENKLRDVGIKEKPTGESRNLGHEVDLITGTELAENVDLKFIGALFYPGAAFSNSDPALKLEAKLQFVF